MTILALEAISIAKAIWARPVTVFKLPEINIQYKDYEESTSSIVTTFRS